MQLYSVSAVSFPGIHKSKPDIYIEFSLALHFQCVPEQVLYLSVSSSGPVDFFSCRNQSFADFWLFWFLWPRGIKLLHRSRFYKIYLKLWKYAKGGTFLGFFKKDDKYDIQHFFICRPSDSTVSEDAGVEPRTVATTALAVRRSNHSVISIHNMRHFWLRYSCGKTTRYRAVLGHKNRLKLWFLGGGELRPPAAGPSLPHEPRVLCLYLMHLLHHLHHVRLFNDRKM